MKVTNLELSPEEMLHPHPAFMGNIPGGGLYPSVVADFIAAAPSKPPQKCSKHNTVRQADLFEDL